MSAPEESRPKSKARVLTFGSQRSNYGKWIQCGDGSRLGINRHGSVVNLDKDRAYARKLRRQLGKKKAR